MHAFGVPSHTLSKTEYKMSITENSDSNDMMRVYLISPLVRGRPHLPAAKSPLRSTNALECGEISLPTAGVAPSVCSVRTVSVKFLQKPTQTHFQFITPAVYSWDRREERPEESA